MARYTKMCATLVSIMGDCVARRLVVLVASLAALSPGISAARSASADIPVGSTAWVQTTTSSPAEPVADYVSTVFDAGTGQILRVGGTQGTWAWDGSTWSQVAPPGAPPARRWAVAGYDAATGQVVLFGGVPAGDAPLPPVTQYFDTWTWNGARWTQQHPATTPNFGAVCAGYDPLTKRLLMIGDGPNGMQAWAWAGSNWVTASSASLPQLWGGCSMAYDSRLQQLVMLISTSTGPVPELWAWNGSSWSQKSASLPAAAVGSMTYDDSLGEFVAVLNVITSPGPPYFSATTIAETWIGDGTSWSAMQSSVSPRSNVPLSYDSATSQLVALDTGAAPVTTWLATSRHPSAVSPARVFGVDRGSTAVAISQVAFPVDGTADAVVLAREDSYPDALAGGPLAAAKHAPLLLTSSASLAAATKAEIERALPVGGTVYLLGGPTALSDAVSNAISALGDKPVRLAGADRFATAVAIARALGNPTTIYEASGISFADALSAVPAAASQHGAILLTNGAAQATATATYLAAHPGLHFAVGGPAVSADPSARALVGANRYATSEIVALSAFPNATQVFVGSGLSFPDALAGGPVAATAGGPVLLVPPAGVLPEPVVAYLGTHTPGSVTLLGGTSAIGDDVALEIATALAQ